MATSRRPRAIILNGPRIRDLRLRAGLTREALADISVGEDALSAATLKRAEAGKPVYSSSASSIARLLGCALSELIPSDDGNVEPSTSLGGPSVAVLPFKTEMATEGDQVFAEAFAEELINRLASQWFPVIARGTSLTRELSTSNERSQDASASDYLVRGSIRNDGESYRISAQLVEADTERVLWSTIETVPLGSLFRVRDSIVASIVSGLSERFIEASSERSRPVPASQLDAWHLMARGAWHFYRATADGLTEARDYLQRALQAYPWIPFARYLIILSHQHELLNQWSPDPQETVKSMNEASSEFERKFPANAWMYVATAYAAVLRYPRESAC